MSECSCFDCGVKDRKPIDASPMIHLPLSIPDARHPVMLCRGCIFRRYGGREDPRFLKQHLRRRAA